MATVANWFSRKMQAATKPEERSPGVLKMGKATLPGRIKALQDERDLLIEAIEEVGRRRAKFEAMRADFAQELHNLEVGVTVALEPLPDELFVLRLDERSLKDEEEGEVEDVVTVAVR